MKTVYCTKLKNDRQYVWMSEAAYREFRLRLSTEDFHTHKARKVQLDPNQIEHLKYSIHGHSYTDFVPASESHLLQRDCDDVNYWFYYSGDGDCVIETEEVI